MVGDQRMGSGLADGGWYIRLSVWNPLAEGFFQKPICFRGSPMIAVGDQRMGSGLADEGWCIRLSVKNPLVSVVSLLFGRPPKKFLDVCFPVRQFFGREDAPMFQSLESEVEQQSYG